MFGRGCNSSRLDTRFQVSRRNENSDLKKRKRELLLETASLQSPQELEKKAGKIGLVLPAMGKVVSMSP